jgi:transposase
VVSELGSLTRLESRWQLMAYAGLVPREYSNGNKVQRGAITKTGNAQHSPGAGGIGLVVSTPAECAGPLAAPAEANGTGDEVRKISWKAQQRLHKRFTALSARGKTRGQVITALARELLGFMWAIAKNAEADSNPSTEAA